MIFVAPNGCLHCGVERHKHGTRFDGLHPRGEGTYVPPTDAVRLERMRDNRIGRLKGAGYVLSHHDLSDMMEQVTEYTGRGHRCGGTSNPEPCGGCRDCLLAQASYAFHEGRKRADMYHRAGLEWAPDALPAWFYVRGEFHDLSHWMTDGKCVERGQS